MIIPGFILKRFLPNKQKFSVLSKDLGKIYLTTEPVNKSLVLWPGMLISFNIKEFNKNTYLAQNIDIILNPDNNFDLNWIHHVLELCYYFVPLHKPCDEIFSFLYNCFLLSRLEITLEQDFHIIHVIRKIYILKFFELSGFYPEKDFFLFLKLYNQITNTFIDIDNKQKVDFLKTSLKQINNLQIQNIDKWIFNCLHDHPCYKLFKTN